MSWKTLLPIGIAAFIVGIVVFFPARVAAGWIESAVPDVTLGGVSGTLLDGRARYAAGPGAAVEDLRWTLHPGALLTGRISADISIDSDISGFSGTVARTFWGTTTISDVQGAASLGWLAKLAGYTFLPLSANLDATVDTLSLDDNLTISALEGRLQLSNTRWQLVRPPLQLGRFAAVVEQTENGLRLVMAESDGPLAIDGQAQLDASNRFQVDVRLRARAGADDRLENLLEQLGEADAQGWHHVRQQGQL